jgi:hypothetical protein
MNPKIIPSVGKVMPTVEGVPFPFFSVDFTTFVGVFVSLQLYL